MHTQRRHLLAVVPFALLFLVGCGALDTTPGEAVVTGYLEAMKAQDFKKALTYYSPAFYQQASRESWAAALQGINRRVGAVQSYEKLDGRVNQVAGNLANAGSTYVLRYRVTYESATVTETFTVFRPQGSSDIAIQAHNLQAPELLQ
jgi:hypothetical protein